MAPLATGGAAGAHRRSTCGTAGIDAEVGFVAGCLGLAPAVMPSLGVFHSLGAFLGESPSAGLPSSTGDGVSVRSELDSDLSTPLPLPLRPKACETIWKPRVLRRGLMGGTGGGEGPRPTLVVVTAGARFRVVISEVEQTSLGSEMSRFWTGRLRDGGRVPDSGVVSRVGDRPGWARDSRCEADDADMGEGRRE